MQTIAGGSRGISYIYAGRVIAGLGVGAISAVAPAYVSECSPKDVRGRITGMFQVMVAIGVMLSYFINRECAESVFSFTWTNPFSVGVSLHIHTGPNVWRIPLGFQLVPAGIMAIGLITVKESPRWLASKDRIEEATRNLAYLRKLRPDDESIMAEMAEIEAAIEEERAARAGLGLREAFFGKGNFIRFVIAVVIFILQQWSGQNSVNYYAPQIFQSVRFINCIVHVAVTSTETGLDRLHWHVELPACVRYLWYRQDRRDGDLRLLPRRQSGPQTVALHLWLGHGHPVLHHRCDPQDAPADWQREPSPGKQGHGRDAVHLRVLLQHGMGTSSVGLFSVHALYQGANKS